MSFYGQVIQQIVGAINKITVKKTDEETSSKNISTNYTIQGDCIIYPEAEDSSPTITLKHSSISEQESSYKILVLDTDAEYWRKGTLIIDKAGHATIEIDQASNIWVISATSDGHGNVIFS